MPRDTAFILDQIWQAIRATAGGGTLTQTRRRIVGPNDNAVQKFGRRTIANNATAEDIIDIAASAYPFPTSLLENVTVVSTDADDTFGGAGSQTTKIQGVGENYEPQTEIVNNDGLTPAASTKKWWRINRLRAPGNQGVITVADSGTTYAQVAVGIGSSRLAVWTVPDGWYGNLEGFLAELSGNANALVVLSLFVREFGADGWFEINAGLCNQDKGWRSLDTFSRYLPPKCDIRMTKTNTTAAATVTGEFHITLHPVA